MANKKMTLESLGDVIKLILRHMWLWVAKKAWWVKIFIAIVVLLLLFTLARLNLFKESHYRYAKLILPINIPVIDPPNPIITLLFGYEIEDNMGRRTGKLDDIVYSGDRIYLTIQAGSDCWLSIFCVDANKIHYVFNEKLEPSFIEKDKLYSSDFSLDKTVGKEVYYAIATYEKFSFEEEIRPNLHRESLEQNTKGPVFSKLQLELPEKFTQKLIYFYHASRD